MTAVLNDFIRIIEEKHFIWLSKKTVTPLNKHVDNESTAGKFNKTR